MNGVAGRVIVVEDEIQIRRFVCDALRRDGCTAIESISFEEMGYVGSDTLEANFGCSGGFRGGRNKLFYESNSFQHE